MSADRCPRRHDVEPKAIFDMRTGVGGTGGTVRFRCVTPDPRVWVKFGVLWVPQDGSTAPGAATLTLWVSQLERSGIGDQGPEFPVEDLLGTSAAPLAIPTNAALFGKFVEVTTAKSGLQGVMVVTTPTAGVQGTWYAKASYTPAVEMSREEWDKLVGLVGGIAADNVVRLSV
jgi:hypothetical protein